MAFGLRTSILALIAAGVIGWALPRRILANIIERIQTISRRIASVAMKRPRLVLVAVWVVALIPIVQLTLVVRHYGVNVPTLDDWAMAPLIVKAHTGQLHVADIFQQQQEARTALPNLIFILSAWHEWNVRDQMLISVISSVLTAAGIFVLLRRSRLNLPALAICFWLIVLALFSTAPFELWIFASGFPSFLPLLFLVTALTIIETNLPIVAKFLICAALAAASTFTLAHGLLAWVLTFPVILFSQRPLRWRFWLGLWCGATAICAALYFRGYEKPAYLPPFAPTVSLLDYNRFFLEFLGCGLAYSLNHHPETAATIFGVVQIALLLLALFFTAKRRGDREFVASVVPWFALALFSLGSAFLATLGRVGYGVNYALSSRYAPFSVGLTVAVIALTGVIFADRFRRVRASRRWRIITATILVFAYLVPYRFASGNTLWFLEHYSADDRLAKAGLFFCQVIDASPIIKRYIFPPRPEHVVQYSAALDDLGLLRPPLARSNRLSALPHEAADGSRPAGLCETIVDRGENYQASGWALLKGKRRNADCVAVFAESPGTEPTLIALSDSVEMRWDIARAGWPNDYLWSGWRVTLPRAAIPPNARLSFWAVDADEPRLYQLEERAR
ncbi:MAG: hypothetical protein ABR611_14025 [Chthoniobacterales bacterium]